MANAPSLLASYAAKFAQLLIGKPFVTAAETWLKRLLTNQQRYLAIQGATGVPWYFVGAVHMRESGMDFSRHLHNGDPLTARTVRVPAGRPVAAPRNGKAYTFEESAIDALRMRGLDKVTDWSLPNLLVELENYNGAGYRSRGLPSPYLWSGSQHYTRGKFVADGVFDPNAIDTQLGAAVLIKMYLAAEAKKKFLPDLGGIGRAARAFAEHSIFFLTGH